MRFFTGINHQLVQDFSATRPPQILSDTRYTSESFSDGNSLLADTKKTQAVAQFIGCWPSSLEDPAENTMISRGYFHVLNISIVDARAKQWLNSGLQTSQWC